MYTNQDTQPSSHTTWILVANSSEAKLYRASDKDLFATNLDHISLELIETLTHPQSREKDSELTTDNLGRFAQKSSPTSTFSEATDPHEAEKEKFAKELAALLEDKRKAETLHKLILICPARFYGDLNKHLSKHTSKLIQHVLEKDYTKAPHAELIKHLKHALSLQ